MKSRKIATQVCSLVVAFALTISPAGSQPSLQPGIAQTQAALDQVDKLIAQNDQDLAEIFASRSASFAGSFFPGFGAVKDAKDLGKSLINSDYLTTIEKSGDLLAKAAGELGPLGKSVEVSAAVINDYFQLKQTEMLREQQEKLVDLHNTLELNLYRLEAKNPKDLDQSWEKYLFQDDDKIHQAFQDWLARNNVTEHQLAQQVQAKADVTIVEPDQSTADLSKIPGINPDFIDALRRCAQENDLSSTAGYVAAMECNKYPDGSYIPAFLSTDASSDGITISNQLVANSVAPGSTVVDSGSVITDPAFGGTRAGSSFTQGGGGSILQNGSFWQKLGTTLTAVSQVMQAYQTAKGHPAPASQPVSSMVSRAKSSSGQDQYERAARQLVNQVNKGGTTPVPAGQGSVNCFEVGRTTECVGNPNFPH